MIDLSRFIRGWPIPAGHAARAAWPRVWPQARLAACLFAALAAGGCAPLLPAPDHNDTTPVLTMPATLAGVQDRRQPFAELFERELRKDGKRADEPVSRWLHGTAASRAAADRPDPHQARFAARAPATSVMLVPGLFGDCVAAQSVPFGDGLMRSPAASVVDSYRQYDDLGLRSISMVALPGRASSAHNGRLLADAIRAEAARPGVESIVLVAYSKGLPDSLQALALLQASDGGVPAAVKALVSVAGVVMGTPLADYFQQAYDALSPLVSPFDCTPALGGDLASLTRRERINWLAGNPLPPSLAYFSLVAFAPLEETATPLRPSTRQLAAIDPRNDGQVLAQDAMLPRGDLLAQARADHWDVALPRNRHPNPLVRSLTSGRDYPREALFRAIIRWVVTAP